MKQKPTREVLQQLAHAQQAKITVYEDQFNGARNMLCVVDAAGRFRRLNPAWERTLGYPAEKIKAVSMYALVHPEDLDAFTAGLKRHRRRPLIARFRSFDGGYKILQWHVIKAADGALSAVVLDITASEKVKADLFRRNAILNALSASASALLKQKGMDVSSLNAVIADVGRATNVSRAYICQNVEQSNGENRYNQLYEWVAKGVSVQLHNPATQNASYTDYQEIASFKQGNPVLLHVNDLPPGEMKDRLTAENTRSLLNAPIFVSGCYWGFIGFDECRRPRNWSRGEIEALVTVSVLIGAMLERIAYGDKLKAAASEKTQALHANTRRLKEVNHAMGIIMRKKEKENVSIREDVLSNARHLIAPYVEKLKNSGLNNPQMDCLRLITFNFNEITTSLNRRLCAAGIGLTPTELKVANMVRLGMNSKAIAAVLNSSFHTVNRHRKSIRKKLNINGVGFHLNAALTALQNDD